MDPNWHAQLMVDEINKQSERDALLKETHDTLLQMQEASEKESAINSKRFIIQTVFFCSISNCCCNCCCCFHNFFVVRTIDI